MVCGLAGNLNSLKYVAVDSIIPNHLQPRKRFDEEALLGLADSIAELGVLQPILVRSLDSASFELIAGERRWRAAQLAGLAEVPVVVREVDDRESLEQAVVENLHRSDLNPIEEAAAYQRLIDDFGLTSDQVAARVGKSRPAVANTLRLFQLPASIQRLLMDGDLSAGHARALLSLPDPHSRQLLAERAMLEALSVRALERVVKRYTANLGGIQPGKDPVRAKSTADPGLLEVETVLADRLSTRVSAVLPQQGPGRLVIEFADLEDLDRIFQELA